MGSVWALGHLPDMHLLLTDRLACPRCGPEFGLILLADQIDDQRVLEGTLGCANCREQYPVVGGFGDLRAPPRVPLDAPGPEAVQDSLDPENTLRLAAFVGVTSGPGTVLILGPASRHAGALAALVGGIEVVAIHQSGIGRGESDCVSRLVASTGIPFFSRSFKGVLVSGEATKRDLEEAARVVAAPGRVVVLDGFPGAKEHLLALGLEVLLDEDGVLVAQANQAEAHPLITLRGS